VAARGCAGAATGCAFGAGGDGGGATVADSDTNASNEGDGEDSGVLAGDSPCDEAWIDVSWI